MRSWSPTLAAALTLPLLPACAPPASLTDDDGSPDGGDGDGDEPVELDESRLDRSAANLGVAGCGYPGPGEMGYGTEVGQRLENFTLIDCAGNELEWASLFCRRDDIGVHNRAVLLNIGAGWCEPCREETKEDFPPLYDELNQQGIEIVQVLFQDWEAQFPTKSFCEDWSAGEWDTENLGFGLPFPVWLDQTNDWTSTYLSDPQSATPVNLLLDANANIRWKTVGEKPDDLDQAVRVVMNNPYEP